jgi:dTDP-4-amino-4,6-dideoxygalactose transaminase
MRDPSTTPPLTINDLSRHVAGMTDDLVAAADAVIRSGWYVLGATVAGFEDAFGSYTGAAGCVGVGNGTDALELALRALDVGPGDVVVTVANAGGYGTTAIRAVGARPRWVDIDADTLLMDPAALAVALRERPAAVIVTHLFGRTADIDRIADLTRAAAVPLVEDCAQAHGARVDGRHVGTWGDLGCFSFYPTKNLGALGDGGAVIGANDALTDRVRMLRQYGWESKYRVGIDGGRNSRLDEIQAAFLAAMLPHLDDWNQRRREIAALYSDAISHPAVQVPTRSGTDDVVHLFPVRTSDRDSLQTHLAGHGIPTDVHYPVPDHRQPTEDGSITLAVTEAACREILTLPCFPEMTDAETLLVAEGVNSWTP